jgi:hypothetical protein
MAIRIEVVLEFHGMALSCTAKPQVSTGADKPEDSTNPLSDLEIVNALNNRATEIADCISRELRAALSPAWDAVILVQIEFAHGSRRTWKGTLLAIYLGTSTVLAPIADVGGTISFLEYASRATPAVVNRVVKNEETAISASKNMPTAPDISYQTQVTVVCPPYPESPRPLSPFPLSTTASPRSRETRLQELKDLVDKGYITKEDQEAKKAEILKEL